MKKDVEHVVSVNTAIATFLLHESMVLYTQCQKQPSQFFHHTAVLNIFGNTGGRVLILVMTVSESFTFNRIFTVKTSLLCLLIQLKLMSHSILHCL